MDRLPASEIAPEVRVVAEWHDALNGDNLDRLLDLSHPDVEVGGPRGAGSGSQLLRDWANRAGIRLVPRRFYHANGAVAVEQEAAWTLADTSETTPAYPVASVFLVRGGLVAGVARYDDLASALSAAGLDESRAIED